MPYVSTLIHSIAEHASDKRFYDISIFSQDITSDNQRLLRAEFAAQENFSVRFCGMTAYSNQYKNLFEKWQISVETYFRLFLPDVMADYDKVLYLDGDMIVRRDVAELFQTNIDQYILAVARDVDMAGVYNSNLSAPTDNSLDSKRRDYLENKLKLERPLDYFQAGVILFNLREMRESFSVNELLEFAAKQWEFQDQDVLNYFAQGRVEFLDLRWNMQYDWEHWRIRNGSPRHLSSSIGVTLIRVEIRSSFTTADRSNRGSAAIAISRRAFGVSRAGAFSMSRSLRE